MSQMGGPGYRPTAKSNIYTVLVAVAFVALIFGITAVFLRSRELYPQNGAFDMKIDIKEPPKAAKTPDAPAQAPAAGAGAPAPGATGGPTPPVSGPTPPAK